MAKWHSKVLSDQQMAAGIHALPAFLKSQRPQAIIISYYGFGCRLHDDLLYQPMRVGVAWLDRFIRDSLDQGIVQPGESDFSFEVGGGRFTLKFCHEGDIHLEGDDESLLRSLREAEPFHEFAFELRGGSE